MKPILHIIVFMMLLGAQPVWSATVGLLVDAPSKQVDSFKEQLSSALSSDTIHLVQTKNLTADLIKVHRKWVTLGPNALSALLALKPNSQDLILALFLSDDSRLQLLNNYPNGFTYLDNTPSLKRQLALTKIIAPQALNIGVYYSSMYSLDKERLNRVGKSVGLNLHFAKLKDPLDWDRNALKVLNDVDIVLGVDDKALYNTTTIRSILMRLYRSGKALIGPDKGYVRAGSVASIYSGINETLNAAVLWIKEGGKHNGVLSNSFFEVSVNGQVARSLNIVIDDESSLAKQVKARLNE